MTQIVEYSDNNQLDIDIDIANNSEATGEVVWYAKDNSSLDTIHFTPTSEYYDLYTSPYRMVLIPSRDFNWSDFIVNPTFDVYLSNNSNHDIAIDKLEFDVETSSLDTFPYIYLEQYYTFRNGIRLQNESWTNWGNMVLEYSLLHRNADFSGKYSHRILIPYFEDYAYVDFSTDLISEGLNTDNLEYYLEDIWDDDEFLPKPIFGNLAKSEHLIFRRLSPYQDISEDILSNISFPFEYSYDYEGNPFIFARLYARMSFTNHDFTKEFSAIIPITCVYPGGASNDLVDEFNIELKPEGKNYSITLPYISKIAGNDSERVQVTVKCVKSSIHKLKIKATTTDGGIIISKPINFHNLNGRHSSYYLLKDE